MVIVKVKINVSDQRRIKVTSCVDGVSWRSCQLTAWDDFGDVGASRLQSELEDRPSGWKRSPQQVESLEAGGECQRTIFWSNS